MRDASGRHAQPGPAPTARLLFVPCDAALARAAATTPEALPSLLGLAVEPGWPSDDLLEMLPLYADAVEGLPRLHLVWGLYLVVDRAGRRVIGDVGFKGPPDERGAVEIGYGIAPACQGRGYATEAVGAMIAFARRQPAVRLIRAFCLVSNRASRRVLEKSGFRRVGGDGKVLEWSLQLRRPRP